MLKRGDSELTEVEYEAMLRWMRRDKRNTPQGLSNSRVREILSEYPALFSPETEEPRETEQPESQAPPPNPCDDATPDSTIGAPGFWESMIPLWGSGRAAINDFQAKRWGWGIFNTGMAISDLFLVKSLVAAPFKLGGKLLFRQAATEAGEQFGKEVMKQGAKEVGNLAARDFAEQGGKRANRLRRT